jgi:hypothetical protein
MVQPGFTRLLPLEAVAWLPRCFSSAAQPSNAASPTHPAPLQTCKAAPPPACLPACLPAYRVRLAVDYRVHSRQMLCIGGSQIPFGWSFLSIAKVPASWNPGDVWAVEVELPAGTKVEYKYVILEEQDWTQQVGWLNAAYSQWVGGLVDCSQQQVVESVSFLVFPTVEAGRQAGSQSGRHCWGARKVACSCACLPAGSRIHGSSPTHLHPYLRLETHAHAH